MRITVGVYWVARQESLDACAERLRRHFDLLSGLSEWTRVWYRRPNSVLKGSVPTALATHDDLVRLLARGVNRRDDNREPIVDLGWSVRLWNGRSSGNPCQTNVRCGCYSPRIGNSAILTLESSFEPVLIPPTVSSLREIWTAESGRAWVNDIEVSPLPN